VTQVISKDQTLQVGYGYTRMSGYLSDPYRTKDKRPNEREQHTLSAQYRHFLNQYGGMSWHLDYRFYQDDWGVTANTISSSVWKDLDVSGLHITLAPNVRYHWQHSADFYTLEAAPQAQNEFYSDDFRLSAYGAPLPWALTCNTIIPTPLSRLGSVSILVLKTGGSRGLTIQTHLHCSIFLS